jgi:hypothetical protein
MTSSARERVTASVYVEELRPGSTKSNVSAPCGLGSVF